MLVLEFLSYTSYNCEAHSSGHSRTPWCWNPINPTQTKTYPLFMQVANLPILGCCVQLHNMHESPSLACIVYKELKVLSCQCTKDQ